MAAADVTPQLERLLDVAVRLFESTAAEAILLLVDQRLDWSRVRQLASSGPVLVAADEESHLAGAVDHGLKPVTLDVAGLPVHERLAQALLECVAAEIIGSDAQLASSPAATCETSRQRCRSRRSSWSSISPSRSAGRAARASRSGRCLWWATPAR
jgi:hypothetical protein